MNQKKRKCYSTTFLENKSIFMGILEGVLILAFVRLCICQLISASGVVALTGSGSIKVVFGASICLCEMKQKGWQSRCGGGGGSRESRDMEQHHYDGTCALEPCLSVRERETSVPSFPGSASERTAKCEGKTAWQQQFFFLCVNGLRQIFSDCKRRERFLGQYIEANMEYLTMEKYFSFFGRSHLTWIYQCIDNE